MTRRNIARSKRGGRAAVDRLTKTLVEDIIEASDQSLLAEARASQDDGAALARTTFARTIRPDRREGAVATSSGRALPPADIRALDPRTARRWLDEFMARNPETVRKLTEASHRSGEVSDDEVYGMLETLQKRGLLERRWPEHNSR